MKNLFLKNLILMLAILFTYGAVGQTSTVDYDWGATSGKLTKTVKLIDGQRILDGPLSYSGKDNSPSTMTVKANYKKGLMEGPFSMSWVCPASDGFTFTAQGKFLQDSMDGVWNFVVKGFEQGTKMNKKITLTFKHGFLIQGDINDLINKSQEKFSCDKKGSLHGKCIWKGYEDGYQVEENQVYVHGVKTIYSKKDVASGTYLKQPALLCDTTVVNDKHYSFETRTFSKGDVIYEMTNSKELYANIFKSNFFLGQFKKESYGGGYAPFIVTTKIILPEEFEAVLKK
jgi:hypothetical protein